MPRMMGPPLPNVEQAEEAHRRLQILLTERDGDERLEAALEFVRDAWTHASVETRAEALERLYGVGLYMAGTPEAEEVIYDGD